MNELFILWLCAALFGGVITMWGVCKVLYAVFTKVVRHDERRVIEIIMD